MTSVVSVPDHCPESETRWQEGAAGETDAGPGGEGGEEGQG